MPPETIFCFRYKTESPLFARLATGYLLLTTTFERSERGSRMRCQVSGHEQYIRLCLRIVAAAKQSLDLKLLVAESYPSDWQKRSLTQANIYSGSQSGAWLEHRRPAPVWVLAQPTCTCRDGAASNRPGYSACGREQDRRIPRQKLRLCYEYKYHVRRLVCATPKHTIRFAQNGYSTHKDKSRNLHWKDLEPRRSL